MERTKKAGTSIWLKGLLLLAAVLMLLGFAGAPQVSTVQAASVRVRSAKWHSGPVTVKLVNYRGRQYVTTMDNRAVAWGVYYIGDRYYYPNAKGIVVYALKNKKGLAVRNGYYVYFSRNRQVKNAWKTVSGKKYYFSGNGYSVKGLAKAAGKYYWFDQNTTALVTSSKSYWKMVGKTKHYFDKNGRALTGWIGGVLYDATGKIVKSQTTGTGQQDNFDVMVRARAIVSSITKSSDSKSTKLRKCWNYVVWHVRYERSYVNTTTYGWQRNVARNTLNTNKGNCYGYACAFAALAKAVGYSPYVVYGYCPARGGGVTRHCCAYIGGGFYDPEAQAAGWARGIYGTRYSAMTSYRMIAF